MNCITENAAIVCGKQGNNELPCDITVSVRDLYAAQLMPETWQKYMDSFSSDNPPRVGWTGDVSDEVYAFVDAVLSKRGDRSGHGSHAQLLHYFAAKALRKLYRAYIKTLGVDVFSDRGCFSDLVFEVYELAEAMMLERSKEATSEEITLRDYFAGEALLTVFQDHTEVHGPGSFRPVDWFEDMSHAAFGLANDMLLMRDKKPAATL